MSSHNQLNFFNFNTGEKETVPANCADFTPYLPREGGAREAYQALVALGAEPMKAGLSALGAFVAVNGVHDVD